MKKDIHPTYHDDASIKCACGATYAVGSTVKDINIDICSNCHPFYTGKQKLVDTARRVEKFEEKAAKKVEGTHKSKTQKRAALKAKRDTKVAVRKTVTKKLGGSSKKSSSDKKKAQTPSPEKKNTDSKTTESDK